MSEMNQPSSLEGIHHVTAITGEPQRNIDFYTGVLGLRLVKLTVNFDDPGSYHFYYGDAMGHPGTILTFFAWPGAPRGRQRTGQVAAVAFSIPASALGYWTQRLAGEGIATEGPVERFGTPGGAQTLSFNDPDSLPLELVTHPTAPAQSEWTAWREGPIPERERRSVGYTVSPCGKPPPTIQPLSSPRHWVSAPRNRKAPCPALRSVRVAPAES